MTVQDSASGATVAAPTRWLPLVVIVSAQMLIVANFSAVRISIGGMVDDLETSATSVQSAIVLCSLVTAAFMILAARAGVALGSLPLFRGGVLLIGAGLAGVALSQGPAMLIVAEGVVGAGSAAVLPAGVALIVANYEGAQRTLAIGVLSAVGGAFTMLLAGVLGTAVGWRLPFWILAGVAVLVLVLSPRVVPSPGEAGVRIDWIGVLLSGAGIVLLTVGVNGIASWGLAVAQDDAPFDVLGLSPSLVLMVAGLVLGWLFSRHQRRRAASGRTPLVSPEVVESRASRLALVAVGVILAVSAGYGFLLPLYMQIVQGFDSLETAIRMFPYALSLSVAAVLVTRLVGRFPVPRIVRWSMVVMALGLVIVGAAIENRWGSAPVLVGLVLAGLGTGAPLTLVANVLVGQARPALAGEVGAVRNTASNLGAAIGTAMAGALIVAVLAGQVEVEATPELKGRLALDNVEFITNEQLRSEATEAGLSEAEVNELVRINTDGRLNALRFSFYALAALAVLGAIAAGGLPDLRESPTRHPRAPRCR